MSIQERLDQLNREQAEHAAAHAYAVRCFDDRLRVIRDSCGHESGRYFDRHIETCWMCDVCGKVFKELPTRNPGVPGREKMHEILKRRSLELQ